ncbi:MAG: kanamycin nucleotidyltransferase C-terminal domain-containing protein [Woeseiaceae bacterium]
MYSGPISHTKRERQAVLDRIVADLQRTYGDRIALVAVYGSMARGDDLPHSDVELFCILLGDSGINFTREWVYGPGKAEVNILSEDVARAKAALLDDRWARCKGQFLFARHLAGDSILLDELRDLVSSPTPEAFNAVIKEMIIGELYEWMGKIRNAQSEGNVGAIPALACFFVEHVAQMLGIAHRRCFTTGAKTLSDSQRLPRRPSGYDALCDLVMCGKLNNPQVVADHVEACWESLAEWSECEGIALTSDSFTCPRFTQ